jgi:mono/diheme cytochrome c family protein
LLRKEVFVRRVTLLAVCAATLIPRIEAQSSSSVRDGVYSVVQAKRGQAVYGGACASCHGPQLEGRNQAPPLAGMEFMMNWDGQTLADFFDKIQTTMPGDKPGTLAPEQNADIIAYILSVNKFPAGSIALPATADRLRQIRFEPPKPK